MINLDINIIEYIMKIFYGSLEMPIKFSEAKWTTGCSTALKPRRLISDP